MRQLANSALLEFIVAAGLTSSAVADTGWFWQNPLPTGVPLQAAALIDSDTATVVGSGGTILRTTDGGATWTLQSSGTAAPLNAVCFTDRDTGTAVGGNGAKDILEKVKRARQSLNNAQSV